MSIFSKKIERQIKLRSCVGHRVKSSSGRYLDRPVLLVYRLNGTLYELISINTAKFLVKNLPSYFDTYYTELRYCL